MMHQSNSNRDGMANKQYAYLIFDYTTWRNNAMCEYSLVGYSIGHTEIKMSKPITAMGTNPSDAWRKFARKVTRWNRRKYFFTNFMPNSARKRIILTNNALSINQQELHWYRVDAPSWRIKSPTIKAGNGKTYIRAELMPDTCIRHRNCGTTIPRQQPDAWKWDTKEIGEIMPCGCPQELDHKS